MLWDSQLTSEQGGEDSPLATQCNHLSFTWETLYTYLGFLGGASGKESESHSVVSDSLQPHGLYRP